MELVPEVIRQEVLGQEGPAREKLDQEVFGRVVLGPVVLVQKVPGQEVPVREELRRETLGLQELRRVVLVQEEREGPGQARVAQKKGKVVRLLGVVEVEWEVIVARALASTLDLQLQYHGTFDHFQNSISHHRQRPAVEMVLRWMTLKAEGVQLASWCLVSPALRYKLANPP